MCIALIQMANYSSVILNKYDTNLCIYMINVYVDVHVYTLVCYEVENTVRKNKHLGYILIAYT